MRTILITGGAGFIGSNLCEFLLKKNYKVICLDNLSTGSINNIKHLLDNDNFIFVEGSILDAIDFEVDQIFNLACPASPKYYQLNPINTIKINVQGMLNVLELAKKNNAKFLQASTSEIYGNPTVHPQKESYFGNVNHLGPRACYNEGKRIAELLVLEYKKYGLRVKIARIFNTYGPRMAIDDGRVVPNFINQTLRHDNLTVFGDGNQTRSFCYIDDLVKGLYLLMNNNLEVPVNLGNPDEITILDLAKKILTLTNSNSKIVFNQRPEDDPELRCPDITIAKEKLNWSPKVNLYDGLKKTIDYFKSDESNSVEPQVTLTTCSKRKVLVK